MTVVEALEELRQSPKLKSYVQELSETLRREEAARRRYRDSLTEDVRAEFINGEVVNLMPNVDSHAQAVKNLVKLLDTHVFIRKLGTVRSENSLVKFPRNDYLPDVCFWKKSKAKHFAADQFIYPVPDFICEVLSASTESYDRRIKFQDYEANKVGEYWMADADPRRIEQWALGRNGRYELVGRFAKGLIRSHVVKGFEIPVRAVFNDAENHAALKRLLGA